MSEVRGKARLRQTIDLLNDEQSAYVDKLINVLAGSPHKGQLMGLAYEETSGIDSALPMGTDKAIQDMGLEFNTMMNVMNYQKVSHGRVENLGEQIIMKLYKTLN
jgi:hypothetical protein